MKEDSIKEKITDGTGISVTPADTVYYLENSCSYIILRWQPKEDITAYELSMCLPYIIRAYCVGRISSNEIDKSQPFFRHFQIIEH